MQELYPIVGKIHGLQLIKYMTLSLSTIEFFLGAKSKDVNVIVFSERDRAYCRKQTRAAADMMSVDMKVLAS